MGGWIQRVSARRGNPVGNGVNEGNVGGFNVNGLAGVARADDQEGQMVTIVAGERGVLRAIRKVGPWLGDSLCPEGGMLTKTTNGTRKLQFLDSGEEDAFKLRMFDGACAKRTTRICCI